MNETVRPVDGGDDASGVLALGVVVGTVATALSVTGLLGRLTVASVVACLVVALAAGLLTVRELGLPRVPGLVWLTLPALVPSMLAALLLPPHTWDEVAYGAALPRDFARAGRLFFHADYGAYSAFPANYEALVTASLILTSDVRATQLLNVLMALGMAATSFLFARALGVKRTISVVAAVLFLCAPALVDVTPITKNDVAAGFFQALALAGLLFQGRRARYGGILLSGAFLGMALGVKYSSLQFALALAPFAVWWLAPSGASRADALRRLGAWAASAAVIASPWYLRNLLLLGNPIYPFMNELLGAQNGFTAEHSVLLRESFDGLADFSLRSGAPMTFAARLVNGFGATPTGLLLPGVVLALRPARREVGILLAGTAASYLLLTFFVGFWEPRYILSELMLASSLTAVVIQALTEHFQRRTPAVLGLAVPLVATAIAIRGGWPAWSEQVRDVREVVRGGRPAFIEARVPHIAVARWLNAHMGPGDRVAIGFNVQPFYYLDGPYYHIHPLTPGDLVSAVTPAEVEAALRKTGATLLAFSGSDGTYYEDTAPRIWAYRERLWMAQRRLRQAGRLTLLETIGGVRILRLEPSGTASTKDAGASP